jgi:hypothetical protein
LLTQIPDGLSQSPADDSLITRLSHDLNGDSYFQSCKFYPKPLDEAVSKAVMSDIPTLVFQEALDVQTPLSWAQDILKTLKTGCTSVRAARRIESV